MQIHVVATLLFLGLTVSTSALMSAPPQTAQRLQVPVQGVDETRAPAIERELRALESKGDPRMKLLAEIELDVEKGLLQLVLANGQSLGLEQLERALVVNGARIRRDQLALGEARLVFEGEAGEDAPERLRQALTAGLFAEAEVRKEGDPARLVAHVRPGEQPATHDATVQAVRTALPALKLVDVIWSRPKTP